MDIRNPQYCNICFCACSARPDAQNSTQARSSQQSPWPQGCCHRVLALILLQLPCAEPQQWDLQTIPCHVLRASSDSVSLQLMTTVGHLKTMSPTQSSWRFLSHSMSTGTMTRKKLQKVEATAPGKRQHSLGRLRVTEELKDTGAPGVGAGGGAVLPAKY